MIADMSRPPYMDTYVHWLSNYVMLSQARSLSGLFVSRLAHTEQMLHGAPPYLLGAVDRLLVLGRAGSSRLRNFVRQSDCLPPEVAELFAEDSGQTQACRLAVFWEANVPAGEQFAENSPFEDGKDVL